MLAENHMRVKYSVNPRGNAWSEDENKFGQKMLQKFGWEKGKGLGLREDGRKDHVRVSKKNNNKGLGFKKVFGDNLMSHQDDFNSLLNSLSETHTSVSHADTDDVSKLAEKSCVAKKRVHYHKHVKSKDLSGWTAEDMDSIFGRRKIKMKKPETDLVPSSSPSSEVVALDEAADIDAKSESTGKSVIDVKHGVLTINTGKSVLEYFAMKMQKMKEAQLQVRGGDSAHKESPVTEPADLDNSMEVIHYPEQTIKDKSDSTMDVDHCPEETVKKLKKKKKKKKKVKDEEFEEEAACELVDDVDAELNSESVEDYKKEFVEMADKCVVVQCKKKKKEDKHKKCKETASDVVDCDGEDGLSYGEAVCPTTGETKIKKSKKKKKKEQGCEVVDSKSGLHNSVAQGPVLVNLENQSTVPDSGEQSTAVLHVDIEKDLETRDEDVNTRKKKKKRSREEMDSFNQEDSMSAGVFDKVSTEECTAPKSRKHKEQLKKERNVLHENVNEEQTSTVPDETVLPDCSVSNPGKTEDSQLNISLELMCRKDIKHNTEAIQSALEHFQLLGANVLDIIGYSV